MDDINDSQYCDDVNNLSESLPHPEQRKVQHNFSIQTKNFQSFSNQQGDVEVQVSASSKNIFLSQQIQSPKPVIFKRNIKKSFVYYQKNDNVKYTYYYDNHGFSFAQNSLTFFSPSNKFRETLFILSQKYLKFYQFLILLFCILNIIAYILHDYSYRSFYISTINSHDSNGSNVQQHEEHTDSNSTSQTAKFYIDLICNIFFGIETLSQIVIMGFAFESGTYLRNMWNWFNLISVISSFLVYFVHDEITQNILNALKMIRPIRIIQTIGILRRQLETIVIVISSLSKNFISLFIVMVIYSIIGLQLYAGSLEFRCRSQPLPPLEYNGAEDWHVDSHNPYLCGQWQCPENTYCAAPFQYGQTQDKHENEIEQLNYGFTNFDSFLWSLLTTLHFIRIVGWSSITYLYQRHINQVLMALYSSTLIIFVSLIQINLLLGSFYNGFVQTNKQKTVCKILQPDQQAQLQSIALSQQQEQGGKSDEIYRKKSIHLNDLQILQFGMDQKVNGGGNNSKGNAKQQQSGNDKENINNYYDAVMNQQLNKLNETIGKKNLDAKHKKKVESTKRDSILQQNPLVSFLHRKFNSVRNVQLFKYMDLIFNLNAFAAAVILCVDNYQFTKKQKELLEILDFASLLVFFFEVLFKIKSQSAKHFFRVHLNNLDFGILIANIFEIIFKIASGHNIYSYESIQGPSIKALKILRLFRIVYQIKFLRPLDVLIYAFMQTIRKIIPYMIIIVIYCVTLTLIGRELFAYQVDVQDIYHREGGHFIRVNFNSYEMSLESIFLIILNEEWYKQMELYMLYYSIHALWFYIFVLLSGEFVLMKLFLALFINTFIDLIKKRDALSTEENEKSELKQQNSLKKMNGLGSQSDSKEISLPKSSSINQQGSKQEDELLGNQDQSLTNQNQQQQQQTLQRLKAPSLKSKFGLLQDNSTRNIGIKSIKREFSIINEDDKEFQGEQANKQESNNLINIIQENNNYLQFSINKLDKQISIPEGTPAYLKQFSSNEINPQKIEVNVNTKTIEKETLKSKMLFIINTNWFQIINVTVIIINCIIISMYRPTLDPYGTFNWTLYKIDLGLTIFQVFEIALKMWTLGLYKNGPNSYFRNAINILDFITILLSLIGFILQNKITVLKAFRAIAILKLAIYSQDLKVALLSLLRSIPMLLKLSIFVLIYLLFIALFPMKYMQGKMYYCSIQDKIVHQISQNECMDIGGDWLRYYFHWDNMGQGLLNSFIIATSEGWIEFIFQAEDSEHIDIHGKNQLVASNKFWSIFFIFHFFVGNLMVFNTFVGVLIEKYMDVKEQFSIYKNMLPEQKEWEIIKSNIYQIHPNKKVNQQKKENNNNYLIIKFKKSIKEKMGIFYNYYTQFWSKIICLIILWMHVQFAILYYLPFMTTSNKTAMSP